MTLLYSLDLLGTAAFAASGALAGIRRNMDLFGVLVLGMVTATCGGMMRDIMSSQVPLVLQKEINASACLLGGGALLYVFHSTPLSPKMALILAASAVTALRICAIHFNWSLPKANR